MVDVSSQSNKVNITVSSSGVSSNVNASGDTSHYYSEKAREWAISNRIVDGVDYSSKYYAQRASNYKDEAQNISNTMTQNYGVYNSNLLSTKDSAVESINTNKTNAISEINSAGKSYDNLTHKQITNCLLEVPQNIKLELNNGILTLKAGSKVIVPNGAGVFDEVIISQDIGIASGAGQKLLMVTSSGTGVTSVDLSKAVSGATDSLVGTTYHAWHDTTNNVILRYGANTNTPSSRCSFPIAIVTFVDSTTISSIDQVFNGIGYIGSTVWCDKGVKGLIPNGRNADGSLKNIEVTTSKVSIHTLTSTNDRNVVLLASGNIDEPSGLVYSEAENRNYNFANIHNVCDCGTVKRNSNGVITSLDIKQPFRAVDYNDYKPAIDNKVSKSGDTMSGNLKIKNGNIGIQFLNDKVTSSTNPSQYTNLGNLFVYDKDGQLTGYFQNAIDASLVSMSIGARRKINGTDKTASCALGVDGSGVDYFNFPRCTTKATTTSSARNNKVAVVVENYVNGTSWRRVWSDGWIEQGGKSSTVEDSSKVISFTKQFSNINYTLTIGTDYSTSFTGNQQGPSVYYGNCTVSGFTAYHASHWITGNTEIPFRWYACGY